MGRGLDFGGGGFLQQRKSTTGLILKSCLPLPFPEAGERPVRLCKYLAQRSYYEEEEQDSNLGSLISWPDLS